MLRTSTNHKGSGRPEGLDFIVQVCDVVIILRSLGSIKPIGAPHIAALLVGAFAPGNGIATLGECYQQAVVDFAEVTFDAPHLLFNLTKVIQ